MMSGFLSTKTSLAIAVQADAVTRATVTTPGDLLAHANLTTNNEVFTVANPEYTGSIHAVGDAIFGRAASMSFDVMLRGPGGASPPAAGTYVPGRILRAGGFDEIVFAGKASAALDAGGSNAGTTTTVVLDATASAVDDFYVGMVIQFAGLNGGSGVKSTSTIIDYNGTTKTATLGEKLASVPTGNFTIPPQLVYRLNATASQLYLTCDKWHDKKRYYQQNGVPSQLQMTFPTSNRGETALPVMSVGISADIDESQDELDENAPLTPALGSIPPVRDGKLSLNGVYVGGSSVSYDHGIQVGFPPNPNKPSGNDAGCIVRTQRSVELNLNEVLLSVQDLNALANAGTSVPLMLTYGVVAGKTVSFTVPSGRLNFSNADPSGDFVTKTTQLLIDGADKAVAISFPYFT
jgi:hypothetical protein